MKWLKRMLLALIPPIIGGIVKYHIANNQTDIIINNGANAYRTFSTIGTIFLVLCCCVPIAVISKILYQQLQNKKAQKETARKALEPPKREPEIVLIQDGRFQEAAIREYLQSQITSPATNPILMDILMELETQLDRMNQWQQRLEKIISLNMADDLSNTEIMLDKLEQIMFQRIRQVFNLLTITDTTQQPSSELQMNLKQIQTNNENTLEQAKTLCQTVTKYINQQGQPDENSTIVLDNFVQALQEQIDAELVN